MRRCKRLSAIFLATLLSAGPLFAQVIATPVSSMFGGVLEYRMKVFNNTPRALYVVVDFSYACSDGSTGSDNVIFQNVGANGSSEWPLRQCFTRGNPGESGAMTQVTVLNRRWQLANHEIEHDAAVAEAAARAERIRQSEAAMAEENRQREERRRRKRCSVDENGRFELDRVAFGRVPRECHQWFPQMHDAIVLHEEQERQRREDGQRRLREVYRQQELNQQQRQMQADRAKLEAVQRQDALDRKKEQQAATQAQDAARAQQAAMERDAAQANERARANAGRSPPAGVRPQAAAEAERAAAQQAQQAQQAQEAQRQQNLQNARDELDCVNAQGRETRALEQQRNQKVQDDNEVLRELMQRMK